MDEIYEMEELDELIAKLKKFTFELEKKKEILQKNKNTIEIESDQSNSEHSNSDQSSEEQSYEFKNEQEEFSFEHENDMSIDDSDVGQDYEYIKSLLQKHNLSGEWSSVRELYEDLGYDFKEENEDFFEALMEGRQDLFGALTELYFHEENKNEFYEKYISGNCSKEELEDVKKWLIKNSQFFEEERLEEMEQEAIDMHNMVWDCYADLCENLDKDLNMSSEIEEAFGDYDKCYDKCYELYCKIDDMIYDNFGD